MGRLVVEGTTGAVLRAGRGQASHLSLPHSVLGSVTHGALSKEGCSLLALRHVTEHDHTVTININHDCRTREYGCEVVPLQVIPTQVTDTRGPGCMPLPTEVAAPEVRRDSAQEEVVPTNKGQVPPCVLSPAPHNVSGVGGVGRSRSGVC